MEGGKGEQGLSGGEEGHERRHLGGFWAKKFFDTFTPLLYGTVWRGVEHGGGGDGRSETDQGIERRK